MKKWIVGLALLLVALGSGALISQTVIMQRPLSNLGLTAGVGFGTTQPTVANDGRPPGDGEIFVVLATDTSDPVTYQWSAVDGAWNQMVMQSSGGDVTVSDDLTVTNDLTAHQVNPGVVFTDFDPPCSVIQSDGTVETGVDAELNLIYCQDVGFPFEERVEQTATLSLLQPVAGGGLDVSGDVTNNDGQEIVWAPNPLMGYAVVGTSNTFYFETSITIGDISAFDGDWATGLRVPEAFQDPPQHDGLNTYGIFTLSDNAGDLDIECDVNGGGQANDDTGVTWADGETHVLYVSVDADGAYVFKVDGTTITSTTCNASNAAEAGDKILPFYYHTQGSEGAATGVVINYVEFGEIP